MSFVPQPYLEIVDDLLTGLTGGIVREEQTFNSDESLVYFLDDFPAIAESVKVSGLLEGKHHIFILGQDYIATFEDIQWQEGEGVNWPDENSRFYINYYKEGITPALSDRNVGSATRTLAEAFAREFAILYQQLLLVYKSGFVDTAEGTSLEQVVAILSIQRRSAEYAVGEIVFSRSTPAPADITIPADTKVSTEIEPSIAFETTIQKTLRKGQLSITVPIAALEKGEDGLVAAKTITIINQPIFGIDKVINPEATVIGTEEESDDALRQRAKRAIEKAATKNAIKYAVEKVKGVRSADIKDYMDQSDLPTGFVRAMVDYSDKSEDVVEEVRQAINETRAAGIRVATEDVQEVLVNMKTVISLVDPESTILAKETIKKNIKRAVEEYFSNFKTGNSVLQNRLVSAVMGISGVQNLEEIQISTDPARSQDEAGNIIVASQERAKLGEVSIEITGTPVLFDISVTLGFSQEQPQIEQEIRTKLQAFFESVEMIISFSNMLSALESSEYTVTELKINAEYSHSGLLIRGSTEDITIGKNERALLRNISIHYGGGS